MTSSLNPIEVALLTKTASESTTDIAAKSLSERKIANVSDR
jgi:hypothetical protein